MNNKSNPTQAQIREDRLKAALKANLGRRKAQARAKAGHQTGDQALKEHGAVAPQEKE